MSVVIVKGTYLSSALDQRERQGQKETFVRLDVYQPKSPLAEKTVSIKVEDVSLYQKFQEEYDMGSVIECECSINAYQNKAYYKLLNLVG